MQAIAISIALFLVELLQQCIAKVAYLFRRSDVLLHLRLRMNCWVVVRGNLGMWSCRNSRELLPRASKEEVSILISILIPLGRTKYGIHQMVESPWKLQKSESKLLRLRPTLKFSWLKPLILPDIYHREGSMASPRPRLGDFGPRLPSMSPAWRRNGVAFTWRRFRRETEGWRCWVGEGRKKKN